MGNFNRGGNRGGFGGRSRGFGDRSGGFRNSFGRDRDSGRRPVTMNDATCSACGKRCQVTFRPTGSKPVYCSECFGKEDSSNSNFSSKRNSMPSQSGASTEQFNQINAKLDKIILILQNLELDDDSEDAELEIYEDSDEEDDSEPEKD